MHCNIAFKLKLYNYESPDFAGSTIKKMKKILSLLLLTFMAMNMTAQEGTKTGWLWEVSGNGLAQKSYLFGTCHGDGHDFTREEVLGIIFKVNGYVSH